VELILSAYQLALTCTHMHAKMIHMKIIIKFAWKMGSNQYWPGITISKEISWVHIFKISRDLLPAWLRIEPTNIRSWKN
jgi:hypothetical protein